MFCLGKDHKAHLIPPLCYGQRVPLDQASFNQALNPSREEAITTFLGNPCQGLIILKGNVPPIPAPWQWKVILPCLVPPGPCPKSLFSSPGNLQSLEGTLKASWTLPVYPQLSQPGWGSCPAPQGDPNCPSCPISKASAHPHKERPHSVSSRAVLPYPQAHPCPQSLCLRQFLLAELQLAVPFIWLH